MTQAVNDMQSASKVMAMSVYAHVTKANLMEAENIVLKKQNKFLKDRHNVHIQAIQHYYHLLHKDCPCLDEENPGVCLSPWETIK